MTGQTRRQQPVSRLNPLRQIPGVGDKFIQIFAQLGILEVDDLRGRDPDELYRRYNELVGRSVDRCVLYVFRLAVYFAEHETHAREKLKWWNWKD